MFSLVQPTLAEIGNRDTFKTQGGWDAQVQTRIWDRSPIHRRTEIKEFLEGSQGHDIQVEPLPPYAPDLNPLDAGAWKHLKHVEMRNLACLDLEDLHLELSLAIDRLRHKPHLIQSFYKATGLTI